MFYYPHHIGDFVKDTARLNDSQCMAYLRLIWLYYGQQSPLQNNPENLAFQIGSDTATVSQLLAHFFKLDGDLWRHTRCDIEIANYEGKKEKAKNSANARWINANALRTQSERIANASKNNANREPRTDNHKPVTNEIPDGFALFWSAYPKKTAKPAALKAFKAKKINGELPQILADIDRRASSPDWKKEGGQYIPNPATYLNNRRWEDQTGQQTANIWAGAI